LGKIQSKAGGNFIVLGGIMYLVLFYLTLVVASLAFAIFCSIPHLIKYRNGWI